MSHRVRCFILVIFPGVQERRILCFCTSVGSEAKLALRSVSSAMVGTSGSCLFVAGLPADIVGSQNFQTFSTLQTPHLGD